VRSIPLSFDTRGIKPLPSEQELNIAKSCMKYLASKLCYSFPDNNIIKKLLFIKFNTKNVP
jgi:hypothetical protein